jgi:hypothetical protein
LTTSCCIFNFFLKSFYKLLGLYIESEKDNLLLTPILKFLSRTLVCIDFLAFHWCNYSWGV